VAQDVVTVAGKTYQTAASTTVSASTPDVLDKLKAAMGDVYSKAQTTTSETGRWALGLGFAIFLLVVLFGLTWLIVGTAFSTAVQPPAALPPDPSPSAVAAFKDRIADYKSLSDIQLDRFSQLFQAVVVSAILPLLTLVLGYLFGKEKG
jgi:hypothetical protein